jgi:hypothetical protein
MHSSYVILDLNLVTSLYCENACFRIIIRTSTGITSSHPTSLYQLNHYHKICIVMIVYDSELMLYQLLHITVKF